MIFYQIKSEKLLPKNIINNINKYLRFQNNREKVYFYYLW